MKATDVFINEGDIIYNLSQKYSANTVKAKYFDGTNYINIGLREIGETYIEIDNVVDIGVKIVFEYEILGTLSTDNKVEYDILERINRLEKGMEDMYSILKAHREAIDNRVNITSFKAWTSLIEKKTGTKLIEGNMNHIARELHR